jgi:3-dehydroquinate dehydratase-2
MNKKILLLHGANLNRLGKRNPHHYGKLTLKEIEELTAKEAAKFNYEIIPYQSNHEGALIDMLQEQAGNCAGIIINPGAFTHYSYAIHDALQDSGIPAIEVHLSAIEDREEWRRKSVTAAACIRLISGKKEQGYIEALHLLLEHIGHD